MKKFILSFFSFLIASVPLLLRGQTPTFTMQYPSDTVMAIFTGSPIHDDINPVSGIIFIKWQVIGSDFPADWRPDSVLGICDAGICRANISGALWSGSSGNSYKAQYPDPFSGAKTFDLQLSLNYPTVTTGSHYMTVKLTDTVSGYTKNVTFIVSHPGLAVPSVTAESEVQLYPNPAHSEINAVYSASADIKTVAVYNVIGKTMLVYKVSNTSANLNIENLPSGVYFVRLMNSGGNVVATKKFTKQ